ncbi:phosphatase PAP2 family protein [Marmoricola sp. RAF53]|uniref:phosphatase PAP2 family protein n=1 Tax=Marmoricola sp. RAF53 TaxID=3233059 RepID=UPI003F97E9D0
MAVADVDAQVRSSGTDTGFRRWLSGNAFIELGALVGLAVIYNIVRAGGGPASKGAAMAHAHDIVRIEGWVFDRFELGLNHWIVGVTFLAVGACYFYALMHYVMTPIVLILSRKRGGWLYWRGYWALVIACAIALVSYANFPVAPPRLVTDVDAIDVMRQFSAWGWWGDAASAPRGLGDATNQYAAMPSLHFGWSLWCGIQMWGFGGRKWRIAAVAYPTLQALVVIATANHFGLDVLGGAFCVLTAYGIVTVIGRILGKTGPRSAARASSRQAEDATASPAS